MNIKTQAITTISIIWQFLEIAFYCIYRYNIIILEKRENKKNYKFNSEYKFRYLDFNLETSSSCTKVRF